MARTALVIVDVQNDFANKSGALSVPNADEIYAPIERVLKFAKDHDWIVVLTRDHHPETHCSFKSNGGIWPDHCVQNTFGCDLAPELLAILARNEISYSVILKGEDKNKEEYGGHTPDMIRLLDDQNVSEVVVCGLATDYCVKETAIGIADNGFFVDVMIDGCRHVFDINLVDFMKEIANKGVFLTTSRRITEEN